MDPGVFFLLALVAGLGTLALQRWLGQGGLFTGVSARIPRRFHVRDVPAREIPSSAQRPLGFLTDKLKGLGFHRVELPVGMPDLEGFGHRVILVPFANPTESTLFLMGIESTWAPRSELMLHIITPLRGGRRVETSTLAALKALRPPEPVDLRVVLDADTVEEIWSRHRRALTSYERAEREPVSAGGWKAVVSQVYEGWIETAVRAQRLRLSRDGNTYRLRTNLD